jgi:hypothetical protein
MFPHKANASCANNYLLEDGNYLVGKEPDTPPTTGCTRRVEQPGTITTTRTDCLLPGGVTSSAGNVGHDVAPFVGLSVPSTRADAEAPGASCTTGIARPAPRPPR